jgi:anti-sigma factor RsiW
MNCNTDIIKDLFLGEVKGAARLAAEKHLEDCPACTGEYERLQLTKAALLTVPEEDPLRRIAFVSDKVFEPRWYQRLWRSGPVMGFASAAMLAAAILVHAWRPVPASPPPAAAGLNPQQVQVLVETEVAKRLEGAVTKAVAETREQGEKKAADLVAAAEHRLTMEHRAELLVVQENVELLKKRMNVLYLASADMGARQ